jgi:hypothetical protein
VLPLVEFYLGRRPDAVERMIDEIWAWDSRRLELTHDYIQWLFPTGTPGMFNANAPMFDDASIREFRGSPELQARMVRSLDMMLDFYGLERTADSEGEVQIAIAPTFPDRRQWLQRGNHNHLRLTRILASLRLAGLDSYSSALYGCLDEIGRREPDHVSATTRQYWEDAALR